MKRTRLKPISDKRAKQRAEYRREVRRWLAGRKCEACPRKATECHHKKGRRGDMLLDKRFWMAVCSSCHSKIENEREWAYEMGYLLKRNAKEQQ